MFSAFHRLTFSRSCRIYVLPHMASLVAKKKGNQLYYYVVESARVDGRPRIVHQSCLGSAEKVAALVRDRTAPVPLSATMRDFGLPGALWLPADRRLRTTPAVLAPTSLRALHRPLFAPGRLPSRLPAGPKTEVADWYDRTYCSRSGALPRNDSPRKPSGIASTP